MNKTIDLARIFQDRFSPEDKNGPKHESRERRLLQTYENLREFADLVFTIQSKLYSLIEKHPIPTAPSTKDPIDLTTLRAHIQSEYDMLPKRYQQLIDDALVRFVNNRILSKAIYLNQINGVTINSMIKASNISSFTDVKLTPYGLCITVPKEALQSNSNNSGQFEVKGIAETYDITINRSAYEIYTTYIVEGVSDNERDEYLRHEHEHILQKSQSIFRTPENLARLLSSKSALSSDSIDLCKLSRSKIYFDTWKSEIYSDPKKLNDIKFLKELRANFFISVRREIFAYMTATEIMDRNQLRDYFINSNGHYNRVTPFKNEISRNGFTLNEALWYEIMVIEYTKIVYKAIDAYFSLIEPNPDGSLRGIEREKASSFLGMYSLEDWSDYARRYNTREYTGTIIEAPLKIFEYVKSSLEILRKLPWYNSMQRYLKNIEYLGNYFLINKDTPCVCRPEHVSREQLALFLALTAYRSYCEETKNNCDEESFYRDLIYVHKIGSDNEWRIYQEQKNPLNVI